VTLIEEKFLQFLTPLVEHDGPDSARSTSSTSSTKSRKSTAPHSIVKSESHSDDITPMEQLCVCLNNIEAARQQLNELCTSMESSIEDVGDNFTETFQLISKTVDKLLDMIMDTKEMISTLESEFIAIIFYKDEPVDAVTQPCLSHLDKQLELFDSHLYEGMFKKAIKAIWRMIMENVRSLFYPHKGRVLQVERIRILVNILIDFFYADGDGVTKSYMIAVEDYKQIERFFSLNTLSSEELCRIHTLMAESGDESIPPAIVMYMLEARNDPKAKSYTSGKEESSASPKSEKTKTKFSLSKSIFKKKKDKN